MNDREALGEALHEAPSFRTGLQNNLIDEAAYERLAQLPEKRVGRVELGEHGLSGVFHNVYPAELVERIAAAVRAMSMVDRYEEELIAVAVLDALNGETE